MWSDESACLPQSLRSRHLIAHENPSPSCAVSRYRSVRPLPLKEESGPFFLACAIAASGRLVRTMYATQSGESSAFSVIFSAFSDESPLFFTPSCPLSAGFSLATDTLCADGGKAQPITAATCAERAGRRPVGRVRSEGVTNTGRSVGLLRIDHDGASRAADVLLAEVVQGRMQFAERVPVASRRYTKKAGRRKVYVCRREDVQFSAVRNRASRGARLITPSRVCGFSACH